MKQKKLSLLKVKESEILSRNEMKHIMAGSVGCGIVCQYYVSGSWTGKLNGNGCTTTTVGGSTIVTPGGVGGSVSVSTTVETCCYDAYDPYNLGYEGEKCINGAVARQC